MMNDNSDNLGPQSVEEFDMSPLTIALDTTLTPEQRATFKAIVMNNLLCRGEGDISV